MDSMKTTTYFHDKKLNKIYISPTMKKCKNGLKIYFSRNVDERAMSDYPIAYADSPKGDSVDWIEGFEIVELMIKRPRFFGLFGKWELAENVEKICEEDRMKYGSSIRKGAKRINPVKFFHEL